MFGPDDSMVSLVDSDVSVVSTGGRGADDGSSDSTGSSSMVSAGGGDSGTMSSMDAEGAGSGDTGSPADTVGVSEADAVGGSVSSAPPRNCLNPLGP